MKPEEPTPSRLDVAVEQFLSARGQGMSRRGILARLTKLSLGLLGVSLLPSLPIDRTFTAEAQGACCDWKLCGINGALCNPGGAGATSCPSGTSRGGAWSKCCNDTSVCPSGGKTVSYWDCCATTEAAANAVKGTVCQHNTSVTTAWCPDAAPHYGCTYATVGSSCTSNVTNNPC